MRQLTGLSIAALALPLVLLAASSPADEPTAAPEAVRAAVERSLPLLTKGAVGHRQERTCFACHNQAIPILALTTARLRGFAIDEEELKKQLEFIAAFLNSNRDRYLQGKGQGGQVDTAGYALWALSLGGWEADETTAAVSEYLLAYQQDSDHWKTTSNRPPSEASLFTTNYVAIRAVRSYRPDDQLKRIPRRIAEVREFVCRQKAEDTEDRVFRLWALAATGASSEEIAAAAKELAATQQGGGGWRQLDSLKPDAYATGTALVALHLAGGMSTSDPAYQRGVAFLLASQLADGSWHVASRSKPFQAYYESGFPHGKDQFISCSASAWATTALALACPSP